MTIFKKTYIMARELMQLNGISTNAYRYWTNQESLFKIGKHWIIDLDTFVPPKRKVYDFSKCTDLGGYALLSDYQNYIGMEKEYFSTLKKRMKKYDKKVPFTIIDVSGATFIKVPSKVLQEYNKGNIITRVTAIDAVDYDTVFFEEGVLYGVY